MEVTVTQFVRSEGTIAIFRGLTDDGAAVVFACDHRPALDIVNALIEGDEDVTCFIEAWQIVGAAA
jgi:hypothetical protein